MRDQHKRKCELPEGEELLLYLHSMMLFTGRSDIMYNIITIRIATGVYALVAFLYDHFCCDSFKKLIPYKTAFFTDLQSRSREKNVWFPKIYYQMEKGCFISAVKLCWGNIKTGFYGQRINWRVACIAS